MAGLAPAAALGGLAAAPAAAAMATTQPQALTRSAFLACVGETFTFDQSALEQVAVKLAQVQPLGDPASPKGEGRFVLHFEASSPLPQETYRVHHPRFGSFALFVSANAAGDRLEAVFNQL
jgi:hypothetical protein